jgi:hypothetical protein
MGIVAAAAGPSRWRQLARAAAWLGATAAVLNALPALVGHHPLAAARAALAAHRSDYTLPRSYSTWLLLNLWDFAVFVGLPIALLALARGAKALAALLRRRSLLDTEHRTALALAAGVAALSLSGLVRGEAGRIWIPIMPFVLVVGRLPNRADAARREAGGEAGRAVAKSIGLALLLLASCWVLRLSWHLP